MYEYPKIDNVNLNKDTFVSNYIGKIELSDIFSERKNVDIRVYSQNMWIYLEYIPMIDHFIEIYRQLLSQTNFKHHRYLFYSFNITNRLTGLIGARGTGKTTLLLQFIKEKIENRDECIYLSVDNIYFSKNLLFDFVRELYEDYGVNTFFFDEIHRYGQWQQELKNIYDSYPNIKVVFSGSSTISISRGSFDLSRRGVIYQLAGMSFREHLFFNEMANIKPLSLKKILKQRVEIEGYLSQIKRVKGHFKEYIGRGYYPFYLEDKESYYQKILRMIDKTIYEDIPAHFNLKTKNLSKIRQILLFLATIPPGDLSINNLSKNIGLDNKTVATFVEILEQIGLVESVCRKATGSAIFHSKKKLFLQNPDIYMAMAQQLGNKNEIGTIREIFFIRMLKNACYPIFKSQIADFEVNENIFEIGGRNKKLKQIRKSLQNSFLVKDNILFGNKYEIPLYLFGFLY